MTKLVDEPDEVVATAWEVLQGEVSEGTKNVRRGAEDETAFVYRVDPEANDAYDVDESAVRSDGEFPDADVTLWRADRGTIEDEIERRGLEGRPDPDEVDTRDEGFRQR